MRLDLTSSMQGMVRDDMRMMLSHMVRSCSGVTSSSAAPFFFFSFGTGACAMWS